MDSGWNHSEDHEITDAQRWTPQRKLSVVTAYLHLLQKWQQRPWHTVGSEHVCGPNCPWFSENDVVFCARSGNFHVCGDVCEHAIMTHEARVCALTQRSVHRDMRPDPYEAPTMRRSRYQSRPRGSALGGDAKLCASRMMPRDSSAEHVERVATVIQLTWELVNLSPALPKLRQKYTIQQHAVVVARTMRDGMFTGKNNELTIVPREAFMATALPSLKVLSSDDPNVRAHTRSAKSFRSLLHAIPDSVLRAHSKRIS